MPEALPTPIDIFTEDYFADPHRTYSRLRAAAPVHRVLTPNKQAVWLVIGHAQARDLLADPRLSKDVKLAQRVYERHTDPAARDRDFAASMRAHMLNTDPPEHTRLRTLVGRAFTPRTVENLRPRIREIAEEVLARAAGRLAAGEIVDLVEEVAVPVPIAVICELLGIPEPARDTLRGAVGDLLSIGDPTVIDRASHTLAGLIVQTLEAKRRAPGEDLLTRLLEAHDDGDRLSTPELVSMAMLMLVAGHETTMNLIANGALALLQHPHQQQRLRDDPDLIGGAIEELLRYEGPNNLATFRFTTEPIELGDTVIPAEHPVVVSPLAANRDPARYPDPDTLDLSRDASGHLAFGHGLHHCLGAALGRAETALVIPGLLDLLAGVQLAVGPEQLRWRRSILVRGMQAMPVTAARTP